MNKSVRFPFNSFLAVTLVFTLLLGCSKDDPKKEDTPELITKATLTFTPVGGGTAFSVSATDPDGEGVQDIVVDGPIDLAQGSSYVLTVDLINGLVAVGQPGYDITEEVEEEGAEHQFFFAWTNDAFSDPSGNGNFDNSADDVNYTGGANSVDSNGLNLGLTTTWTTDAAVATGTFRIVLKHQPELKSATTGADVGETDLDLTFILNVQ